MSVYITIQHSPWRPERVTALEAMLREVGTAAQLRIHAADYRGCDWQSVGKVQCALDTWEPALRSGAKWCVFLTDDLHLVPGFLEILAAMLTAVPDKAIGLLSNSPQAPALRRAGWQWYRTNSWLTGPGYILPRAVLEGHLAWYKALPKGSFTVEGDQSWFNDDSSINEWITRHGPGETWHPLPAPIEHRVDLASTVGHGDCYSRERLSWREHRYVVDSPDGFRWVSTRLGDVDANLADMRRAMYWVPRGAPPMITVGEGR